MVDPLQPSESAVNMEHHGARHLESDTDMRYRESCPYTRQFPSGEWVRRPRDELALDSNLHDVAPLRRGLRRVGEVLRTGY